MASISLQTNYLNKLNKLIPTSDEWKLIQYKLQLFLKNTTATIKNIWTIHNPQLQFNF